MTKKFIILGTIGIGVIVTAVVVPIVLLNQNDGENDKKDVEAVAKILNEKTSEQRIIKLASDSSGKIIENNKEKIIAEIKKLITDSKLRGVKIEVSIENDVDVSTDATQIIVTLKKGETSILIKEEKVGDNKGFKVKRSLTNSESVAKVRAILDSKATKLITIDHAQDSKIDTNSQIIEKIKIILEKEVGEDKYGVTIIPSKDTTNATIINSGSGISFIITLSKGSSSSKITNWKVKRESEDEQIVDAYILKLKALSTKEVTIVGTFDLLYSNNKDRIMNKIKALPGFPPLPNELTLKIKDYQSEAFVTTSGINAILAVKKGEVEKEISIFSVKRTKNNSEKANDAINSVKGKLDAKIGEDLIIILPNNTTGNVANNKGAIEEKLRKLIDPINNPTGNDNHESLLGTTIEVSASPDGEISPTNQDIIVTIIKIGISKTTSKTFQVKREKTNIEKANDAINSIKGKLDAKTGDDLTIILPSNTTGNVANNKGAIEQELRKLIDPINNPTGNDNHESLLGTTIEVSASPDGEISSTSQNIIVTISKIDGTSQQTTKVFKVKREKTNAEKTSEDNVPINSIKGKLDAKIGEDLIIILPNNTTGNVATNKGAIEQELRKLIDPINNPTGNANHQSLLGTTITVLASSNVEISPTSQDIIVTISKSGISKTTSKTFQVKREKTNAEKANDDINSIKEKLEKIPESSRTITLPSNTTGTFAANKAIIIKKLRKLIDPTNTNGVANHASLKGVTIEVSAQGGDFRFEDHRQNFIVKISKNNGNTKTLNIFSVFKLPSI